MKEILDDDVRAKKIEDLREHLERFNALSPIFDRAMEFSHKSDEALMSDDLEGGKKALEYVKECNRLLDLYKELHMQHRKIGRNHIAPTNIKLLTVGQPIEITGRYICYGCKSEVHLTKGDICRGCPICKQIFYNVFICPDED